VAKEACVLDAKPRDGLTDGLAVTVLVDTSSFGMQEGPEMGKETFVQDKQHCNVETIGHQGRRVMPAGGLSLGQS